VKRRRLSQGEYLALRSINDDAIMMMLFTDVYLCAINCFVNLCSLVCARKEENVNNNNDNQKEEHLQNRRMYQIRRQIRCMRRPWGKQTIQTMRHRGMYQLCSKGRCCTNVAQSHGVCRKHGAKRSERKKCSVEGCEKIAQNGGVCIGHGATKKKPCSVEGCERQTQKGGVCYKHNNNGAAKSSQYDDANDDEEEATIFGIHVPPIPYIGNNDNEEEAEEPQKKRAKTEETPQSPARFLETPQMIQWPDDFAFVQDCVEI